MALQEIDAPLDERGRYLAIDLARGAVPMATIEHLDRWHRLHPSAIDVSSRSTLAAGLRGGAPGAQWVSAVTAAVRRQSAVQRLGDDLAQIDRETLAEVRASLDASIARALGRLDAKPKRSRAKTAALGDDEVLTEEIDDDDLATIFIVGQARKAARTVKALGRSQRRRLAASLGLSPDDDLEAAVRSNELPSRVGPLGALASMLAIKLAKRAKEAAVALKRSVVDRLRNRLSTAAEGLTRSIRDGIPFGVVRDALGTVTGQTAADDLTTESRGDLGDLLSDVVGLTEVYVWNHGYYGEPGKPLDGHEGLDGLASATYEPDTAEFVTRTEDAWLNRTHYAVGDHEGCTCEMVPEYLDPSLIEL